MIILKPKTRVQVDLMGLDESAAIGAVVHGVIVERAVYGRRSDPDDVSYLVDLDRPVRLPALSDPAETATRRWVAHEFVDPLSVLELLAEATDESGAEEQVHRA